ncbi:MAG: hypothetical protein DRP74_01815 [Candidatus Omnitrophota bacterium]|nr:MAG: hypothetical protein DRP74_01815 [Candidatus Omnitrophota bacterium]
MKFPVKNIFRKKSILIRTTLLSWLVIILTLEIFIFSFIPYQRKTLKEDLELQAKAITSSLRDTTLTSIDLEDYSLITKQYSSILSENPFVLYLVITRRDGFSLIFTKYNRKAYDTDYLQGVWVEPLPTGNSGYSFIETKIIPERTFHYKSPIEYLDTQWGWMHVGLSLEKYYNDLKTFYLHSVWLAILCILVGLLIAFFFSRQLVNPIYKLSKVVESFGKGDFSLRAEVSSGDEIENLASSFNRMAQTLENSQKELITAKEYIENIISSITDALIVTDKALNIKLVNKAAYNILGYYEKELFNNPLSVIFREDDYVNFVNHDLLVLVKNGSIINRELNCKTRDGRVIPTLFSGAVMRSDNGSLEGIVIIIKEITDRKQIEMALRDSEQRYRFLFEQAPIGIGLMTAEGRIIASNHAMQEIFGYSKKEFEKINDRDLYVQPQDRNLLLDKMNEKESVGNFQALLRRKDISVFEAILNVSKIRIMGKDLFQTTYFDLSERKKIEDQFKEAKEKAELLYKVVPSAIFTVDKERRITSWNDKAKEITGYSFQEVVGKECSLFAKAPCEDKCGLYSEDIDKPVIARECMIICKGGEKRIISKNADFLKDASGNIIGGIESFEDITERKKTEGILKESEKKFRDLAELLPQTIFEFDTNLKIRFANKIAFDVFGYQPEDLDKGLDVLDMLALADRDKAAKILQRVLKGERVGGLEFSAVKKDGNIFPCIIYVNPILSENKVTGIRSVLVDITERKEIERALRESEEKMRAVLENSPDVILSINRQYNILFVNRLGMDGRIIIGESCLNFVKQEFRLPMKECIDRVFASAENDSIELAGIDGKWYSCRLASIRKEGTVSNVIIIGTDDTQRKAAEDALRKAYHEIKTTQNQLNVAEKMAAIGRIASGVAHEIKNPLAIIMQGVEYLSNVNKTKDKNINSTLLFMNDAVVRANRIVKGILDYSSMTKMDFEMQNLSNLIINCLLLLKVQLAGRNIEIIKEISPDLPQVRLDKNRIEQVFINILMNAIQSMPAGGKLFIKGYKKELHRGEGIGFRKDDLFTPEEKVVFIDIINTGSKIPAADLDKIFEPFYTTRRDLGGTGLGLFIVKNIMEMHRGDIKIENIEDGVKVSLIFKIERQG